MAETVAQGLWHVASSEHAIAEARRNLAGKYPRALDRLALVEACARRLDSPLMRIHTKYVLLSTRCR